MDPREEFTEARPASPVEASVERLRDLSMMLAKRLDELSSRLAPVRRAIPLDGGTVGRDDDRAAPARSSLVAQLDELAEMNRDRITSIEEIIASLDL